MPIRNLNRILSPHSIAVIGASDTPGKVGYTVVANLVQGGFEGPIYPINPQRENIQGLPCFRSLQELPTKPDLAIICTPAPTVATLIRQCGECNVEGVIILTAGFRELGPEGIALEEAVRQEQRRFPGLRIVGPNCLGIISPWSRANASFAAGMPRPGSVAFLSQSGALCTAVLDWALTQGIGFSHFISLGNQLDAGFADMLDYLAEDPRTSAALLYIESVRDSRYFMSAARAFARRKPLIAYKAGRFAESAQAAASHTGAMAGVDAVYQAAFDRAGIVRVFDMESLFECAELLTLHPQPVGPRLAIVTNAGGPGVMATDALLEHRGQLARLHPDTIQALNEFLPPSWSHGNPIDVLGDADEHRFAKAVELAIHDENVDTLLAILTPQAMTKPTQTAALLGKIKLPAGKTILASWMGGDQMFEGKRIFHQSKIPSFDTPEQAIRGLSRLLQYDNKQQVLCETPKDLRSNHIASKFDRAQFLKSKQHPTESVLMTEVESKQWMESYGIPTTSIDIAESAVQAGTIAESMGYPVVLKIHSPQITHKTDVDGVRLNLKNRQEVETSFEQIMASARKHCPDATLLGTTVQPMVSMIHGVELILGAKRDPIFGTVMMVGFGGIAAELFQDRSLELPPIDEKLALRMLKSLQSWPLLSGYRGRASVDLHRLVEILLRFSAMIVEQPEILEIDINPLLVSSQSMIALDARIVLRPLSESNTKPYAHLAIRPYPSEFSKTVQLSDGTNVRLRPIRPEDEPAWRAMLGRCSKETLWSRFHMLFKEATHEMATRFCFLDYDREIAMVAEPLDEVNAPDGSSSGKIVGVGRLAADVDHRVAEFAILVEDEWQNRGLGIKLAEHSLAIAKPWGVQTVIAETTPHEQRMVAILRHFGFTIDYRLEESVILGSKDIV